MYQSFNCILQNASMMIIHILALAIVEGLRLRKAYVRISLRIYNLLGIRLPTLFVLKNVRVFPTSGQTRNRSACLHMRFLMRFLVQFRVKNAPYPTLHEYFFREASREMERKLSHIISRHPSFQFLLEAVAGFVRKIACVNGP